ncbi:hypothetical protein D3C71_1301560 [compost metagenome]
MDRDHRRDVHVRWHGAGVRWRIDRPSGRQPHHSPPAPGGCAAAGPGAAGLVHRQGVGRGQAGAAGRHRDLAQPDGTFLYSRGACCGRNRCFGCLPVRAGLAPGHCGAAAVSRLLPFPAPSHEGRRGEHGGVRCPARAPQWGNRRVRGWDFRGQGVRRCRQGASRLPRGRRRLCRGLRQLHSSTGCGDGSWSRNDRPGHGAGRGAGLRRPVRGLGLDGSGGGAAVRPGGAGHLCSAAVAAHAAARPGRGHERRPARAGASGNPCAGTARAGPGANPRRT